MGTDARLLERIDRFCDGVPRSSADPLDLGPFTIFLSAPGDRERVLRAGPRGRTVTKATGRTRVAGGRAASDAARRAGAAAAPP